VSAENGVTDPLFVDSHCHIAGPEFVDDLHAIVQRARDARLAHAFIILAADDEPELAQARNVADRWPDVRFSVGVHPHAAGKFADDPPAAARAVETAMAGQPLTRGLGEIGLDYFYDHAPREVQQQVFREQIRLARKRRLPIVIHTRDATEDTFRILAEESATDVGGVFHCFTGDRGMARRVLDIGFHLSLAGIVTFRNAVELREVARTIPLDRMLIETDSPFLAPVPHRGKRNEPAHVIHVADAIAELRATTAEAIGRAALENFRRVFNP
jgi:TatD DNase family protein